MTNPNIGEYIKNLRQESGLTQLELSNKIEIDVSYLSKIENNRVDSIPEDLARRFAEYFEIDPIEFIYLSGEIPSEHKKAILNNHEIQQELKLKFRIANKSYQKQKTTFYSPEMIEAKANDLIREWGKKNNQTIVLPPIPIREIVESYEEKIIIHEIKSKKERENLNIPENAMGASSKNFEIFLNFCDFQKRFNKSEGSLRFTIAHEFGHCILHFPSKSNKNQMSLFSEEESKEIIYKCRQEDIEGNTKDWDEINANRFAASILMPREHLNLYWNQCQDVNQLASIFQVSKQAMEIRLRALNFDDINNKK